MRRKKSLFGRTKIKKKKAIKKKKTWKILSIKSIWNQYKYLWAKHIDAYCIYSREVYTNTFFFFKCEMWSEFYSMFYYFIRVFFLKKEIPHKCAWKMEISQKNRSSSGLVITHMMHFIQFFIINDRHTCTHTQKGIK